MLFSFLSYKTITSMGEFRGGSDAQRGLQLVALGYFRRL
jgi:hypothetical protein